MAVHLGRNWSVEVYSQPPPGGHAPCDCAFCRNPRPFAWLTRFVPKGEVQFVAEDGRIVGRIVNVGEER